VDSIDRKEMRMTASWMKAKKVAPKLHKPDGPLFLDCKINADVAAPFMSEFAHFEGRH